MSHRTVHEPIYTIGHSTRPFPELVEILQTYRVDTLVDIRTVPKSRRNPQFHTDSLRESLPAAGVAYRHLAALGGLRRTRADSPNAGWRNESFRGYADYMGTPEFATGVAELLDLVEQGTIAIMCAEAVPWRCHRSLVGDALLVRGLEVVDIFDVGQAKPETLTRFAVVDGLQITYPEEGER